MVLQASSKLNSIEKIKTKAFIHSNINHEEFTLVINEEKTISCLQLGSEQKVVNEVKLKKTA